MRTQGLRKNVSFPVIYLIFLTCLMIFGVICDWQKWWFPPTDSSVTITVFSSYFDSCVPVDLVQSARVSIRTTAAPDQSQAVRQLSAYPDRVVICSPRQVVPARVDEWYACMERPYLPVELYSLHCSPSVRLWATMSLFAPTRPVLPAGDCRDPV